MQKWMQTSSSTEFFQEKDSYLSRPVSILQDYTVSKMILQTFETILSKTHISQFHMLLQYGLRKHPSIPIMFIAVTTKSLTSKFNYLYFYMYVPIRHVTHHLVLLLLIDWSLHTCLQGIRLTRKKFTIARMLAVDNRKNWGGKTHSLIWEVHK